MLVAAEPQAEMKVFVDTGFGRICLSRERMRETKHEGCLDVGKGRGPDSSGLQWHRAVLLLCSCLLFAAESRGPGRDLVSSRSAVAVAVRRAREFAICKATITMIMTITVKLRTTWPDVMMQEGVCSLPLFLLAQRSREAHPWS